MRRLGIDTSIYVDWLNGGRYEELLFQRDAVKYLNAVVLMELRAGALLAANRRILRRLEAAFDRAGPILTPSRVVFAEAGDTPRRLHAEAGHRIGGGHSITNDVLIALSARSIVATVVTENERDYRAIEKVRPFRLALAR